MKQLRGMAWDHVRGYAPLLEASRQFKKFHPDIDITWEKRSLRDFESYPVEILAENYDLILIDHPFVGTGVKKSVIEPIDEWVPSSFLKQQETYSVGKSYHSYTWKNHQWALAIDAASQVAAYRPDLLIRFSLDVPHTWDDVNQLVNDLPQDYFIGVPLNPTHAFSCFLTLCAHFAGSDFWTDAGITADVGCESLQFLKNLSQIVHPVSLGFDPIHLSEWMAKTEEIVYTPFMFGYCNYAEEGFAPHVLQFTNIPVIKGRPEGALLGGVGLAVSALSQNKSVAAEFAAFVASEEFQCGSYFDSGGQPGHRKAWLDERVNQKSNRFFQETLETLDLSYMRPRKPGYSKFQDKAGELIHHFLVHDEDAANVIGILNHLYTQLVMIEDN